MAFSSPTSVNWSSGGGEIFDYVNEVSGSVFGWMLILCIYVIFAFSIAYYKRDISMALAISGFMTTVIAIFFRIGGIINTLTLGIVIAVAVLGVLIFFFDKSKEVL